MTDKIKILFLAANPKNVSQLGLGAEFKQIRQKIESSTERDRFELVSEWAVTSGELVGILLKHQPHILHFSGHGSRTQGVALEDEQGNMRLLKKAALTNLMRVLKDNIRMVVLNACYSVDQGKQLQDIVDFTIGMDRAIGDQAAIAFAPTFYEALASGRSVETAFEAGKAQLDLTDIPESKTPKLLVRYGVNPTECFARPDAVNPNTDSGAGERKMPGGDQYNISQPISGDVHGPVTGMSFGGSKR